MDARLAGVKPKIALYAVFVAALWQGVGQPMVLFLAGLQTIPQIRTKLRSSTVPSGTRLSDISRFPCCGKHSLL